MESDGSDRNNEMNTHLFLAQLRHMGGSCAFARFGRFIL